MAVLRQPNSHANPFSEQIGDALAPAGTYVATVIDIRDEFGIQRQRFQSTETEKVDLTCFLFGFRDAQGNPHRIASRMMRISGNEKAALFGFLKSLLGRAPAYGWDYCSLKGQKCLLTVEHVQKRDGSGMFAAIAALSPVPEGYGAPAAPKPAAAPAPRPQPAPGVAPAARPAAPKTGDPLVEDEVPFWSTSTSTTHGTAFGSSRRPYPPPWLSLPRTKSRRGTGTGAMAPPCIDSRPPTDRASARRPSATRSG